MRDAGGCPGDAVAAQLRHMGISSSHIARKSAALPQDAPLGCWILRGHPVAPGLSHGLPGLQRAGSTAWWGISGTWWPLCMVGASPEGGGARGVGLRGLGMRVTVFWGGAGDLGGAEGQGLGACSGALVDQVGGIWG